MPSSALAAALALALGAPSTPGIPDIPTQSYQLANGLTLLVHEDHKAPVVAVNVWYHVGSKNERPGKTGFAHLFEHLMFGKSENRKEDYLSSLDKLGATDRNGTTNADRTNYFQNVPVSALDTVLFMESDRMGHLLGAVDQAKLDEQRGVVQNEKRQGENQPYGKVQEFVARATYPAGHPYSWTTIGSMEDLNAASLDDVRDWFRGSYGPNNAVLVVAGDVVAAEVKAKVERWFGDLPPGPPLGRYQAWPAKRSGTQRAAMQDRVAQARVYKVWNTPQRGTAEDGDLDLASQVLAAGKSSRLYKRLVYDDRIATDVSAFQATREIGSQFWIIATAKPGGDLAAVEQALDEELTRFRAQGPTPDELLRARTSFLSDFVRGLERIGGFGGKSDVLAMSQVFGGRPDAYQEELRNYLAATPARVAATARSWLADGALVLQVLPFPTAAPAASGADRSRMPEPGEPPSPRFPAFTRHQLSNGLKVIVAERHAVPVVGFDLLVDAGYASDAQGLPGTARLAGDMLTEGTRTRTALQISDELQRLGAHLDARSNLDVTALSLSALRSGLDASLALFADVLLHPAFPEADFQRRKALQLAAIERERTEPNALGMRIMPRLLYGAGHAYANPLTGSGTKETVAKLTRDEVARWHATWFRPGSATLVVVGDTSAAEIVPRLERLLAGWRPGQAPAKNVAAVGMPDKGRLYLVDRPGAPQSVILLGEVAPPRANPQEVAPRRR
jgi:zinc protease